MNRQTELCLVYRATHMAHFKSQRVSVAVTLMRYCVLFSVLIMCYVQICNTNIALEMCLCIPLQPVILSQLALYVNVTLERRWSLNIGRSILVGNGNQVDIKTQRWLDDNLYPGQTLNFG